MSAESVKPTQIIGDCQLYLADCMDVLPTLAKVDAVITDPPYSDRTHKGHDSGSSPGKDGAGRVGLGYAALTPEIAELVAGQFSVVCTGWIVWMTDHTLAPFVSKSLERNGRYVFAPLPFYDKGRSVRLSGDGPCSWTDWVVVARTAQQHRWGTLPGGYVAGEGWRDKAHMGGKPTALMLSLVGDYSRRGQVVADPFMGSGTTGVACVQMGRKFIGIEREPKYFDIACRRIEDAYKQGVLIPHEAPKFEQEPLI